ncbi:Uncharacterised protein r2_g2829 [Pycnogonum litorale]
MPRVCTSKPGARNYKSYTQADLDKALGKIKRDNWSVRKASKEYKIPLGTLSHKLNQKHNMIPGHPTVFTPIEEQSVVTHIQAVAEWGFPFDTFDLRIPARTLLNRQGRTAKQFSENLPSIEWAKSFLKRHRAELSHRMCQNIKRARAKVSAAEVKSFFENLKETTKMCLTMRQICRMTLV